MLKLFSVAILSVLTPQEDSQWIPGVEFTEIPPQDLTTSNLLQSKQWYTVFHG